MVKINVSQLFEAGTHYGNDANCWNPKMFPYIYAEKDGIHILDVIQTSKLLNEACNFVKTASQNKKIFLFVGTQPEMAPFIAEEAKKCNAYYVNYRWLGGTLTNWKTVKDRIEKLKSLEQQKQNGIFEILPKKEASIKKKELKKLKNHLSGIKNMPRIPDILIILDQHREITAIKEAISLNIPIISIIDSDCDPTLINIPIPGNNDSKKFVKIFLKALSQNINKNNDIK